MSSHISEEEIYKLARKRVEEKKGFYSHLTAYVLVNAGLILIWYFMTGHGFPWFIFPLFGWGIGLVFHFMGVFIFNKETGWERREIEREAERLRKSGGK